MADTRSDEADIHPGVGALSGPAARRNNSSSGLWSPSIGLPHMQTRQPCTYTWMDPIILWQLTGSPQLLSTWSLLHASRLSSPSRSCAQVQLRVGRLHRALPGCRRTHSKPGGTYYALHRDSVIVQLHLATQAAHPIYRGALGPAPTMSQIHVWLTSNYSSRICIYVFSANKTSFQ
jgi:hypothetical protein